MDKPTRRVVYLALACACFTIAGLLALWWLAGLLVYAWLVR